MFPENAIVHARFIGNPKIRFLNPLYTICRLIKIKEKYAFLWRTEILMHASVHQPTSK